MAWDGGDELILLKPEYRDWVPLCQFWQEKTINSVFQFPPIRYQFSHMVKMKNGYTVVNTGRQRTDFIIKYFGHGALQNTSFLQLLDLHITEQCAVQMDGLLYFDFRVWFEPYNVAFRKLEAYRARMLQVARILHYFGEDLFESDCVDHAGSIAVRDFQVFLNPKTERCIGNPTQVARSILACKQMRRLVPRRYWNRTVVFALCWNNVYTSQCFTETKQVRIALVEAMSTAALMERGLRITGPKISSFLDMQSTKRVAAAFASNFELVFAFSVNAIETDLITKLHLESRQYLVAKLHANGMHEHWLKLLMNRAAECPERMLTIGTEAIKKELQARFEFPAQDHLVIEYCCTMLGGQEFRTKKYLQLFQMEPKLVGEYVTNEFVGTGDEVVACIHIKQVLRRIYTQHEVDLHFVAMRREMLDLAKICNKSWETIGKDVLKAHMTLLKTRNELRKL